jgi:hypothetical protein
MNYEKFVEELDDNEINIFCIHPYDHDITDVRDRCKARNIPERVYKFK